MKMLHGYKDLTIHERINVKSYAIGYREGTLLWFMLHGSYYLSTSSRYICWEHCNRFLSLMGEVGHQLKAIENNV